MPPAADPMRPDKQADRLPQSRSPPAEPARPTIWLGQAALAAREAGHTARAAARAADAALVAFVTGKEGLPVRMPRRR